MVRGRALRRKILGACVAASGLVAFLAGHRVRMLSRPMVMRVAITLLSACPSGGRSIKKYTLSGILRLAQLLIFVLLIWEFAVSPRDHLWVVRAFLIGMIVPMAMALIAYRGASRMEIESGERFTGGGHDLNYLAYMCSVAVMFCVYLATNAHPLDRFLRWCYWGFAIWVALQGLLTGSRGGYLSLLVAGLFSLVMAGVSRRRLLTIVQIVGVAGVILVLGDLLVPSELRSRLTLGGGESTSLADDPRIRIWTAGLTGFTHSPIIGVGFDGFLAITEQVIEVRRAPHNTFIAMLVELGIVGIVLYLIYLTMLFRLAWRLPRREKWLWTGILLISVLNAMTCGSTRDKFTWFIYTLVMVQAARLPNLHSCAVASRFRAASLCPSSRRCVPICESPEDKFDECRIQPAEFHERTGPCVPRGAGTLDFAELWQDTFVYRRRPTVSGKRRRELLEDGHRVRPR